MLHEVTIYVKLLNEGTDVYRPVSAIEIGDNVYELKGYDSYDPNSEEWEFLPGATVKGERRQLSEGNALVAVEEV